MAYHTFIQYNNGLLQDSIDKFKPRTAISSTSKCQNKYIFRQTSPKRPSQAKENPYEKKFSIQPTIQNTVKPLPPHVKFGDSPIFFITHSIHTNGGFLYFCAQFKKQAPKRGAYHTGHAYRTCPNRKQNLKKQMYN